MKDTIIIYCHPNDIDKKDRLLVTILDELKQTGHDAEVFNIIGDVFSPDLLNSDQVEFQEDSSMQSTICRIQKGIDDSKTIVFVFPEFWDGLTMYTRRFIDKVFMSDWGGGSVFATNKRLKNKKAVIITAMKIPQILFSSRQAGGYSDPFTISILKLCGIKNIKWFNINRWSEGNTNSKDKKIEKMRTYFKTL